MPFPQSPRVVYQNNPLTEVICQLRFPTILEIGTTEPATFQKKIRSAYPLYQRDVPSIALPKELSRLLEGLSFPRTSELLTHKFLTEDTQRFISLTQEFVALTEKQYHRWEDFRQEIFVARHAVEEVYQPAFYSRIGLRYQDVIDKAKLGLEDEPWSALIKPEFTGVLGSPDVREDIQQMRVESLIKVNEILGGWLHLRHGLIKPSPQRPEVYFIDADFFTEDREATRHVGTVLDTFNRLAGYLFRWAITVRLENALAPQPIA